MYFFAKEFGSIHDQLIAVKNFHTVGKPIPEFEFVAQ